MDQSFPITMPIARPCARFFRRNRRDDWMGDDTILNESAIGAAKTGRVAQLPKAAGWLKAFYKKGNVKGCKRL